MSCKVIMTASCKGGVGKSTACANLGLAIAGQGKRVLMIDCDFGMRSLDMIAGYSDEVVFDICDCINDALSPKRACVIDQRNPDLMFIAAPYNYDKKIELDDFKAFLKKCAEVLELDYILLDTHGGRGQEIELAAGCADLALIISTHHAPSVRAADETRMRLSKYGVKKCRLIVNYFDKKAAKRGSLPSVIDLIDSTHVQLIGVVPYDNCLMASRSDGHLSVEDKKSLAGKAYQNIARRILGEAVPLYVQ